MNAECAERRTEKACLILSAAKREHRRGNEVATWLFLLWLAEFVGGELGKRYNV